jgi:hypothetical protein
MWNQSIESRDRAKNSGGLAIASRHGIRQARKHGTVDESSHIGEQP